MPKYKTLEEYIDTFNEQAVECYNELLSIIQLMELDVKQRLFAGQVAFYLDETLQRTFHSSPVIVMSFYSDHVNIFASANIKYKNQLAEYKFTNKGTMQIYYNKRINSPILSKLFTESLQ